MKLRDIFALKSSTAVMLLQMAEGIQIQ